MTLFLQAGIPPVTPDWTQHAVALSTIVIAIATLVNLVVAIFMWRVTSEYTGVTKSIFETSYRPYLGVADIKVESRPDNHKIGFLFKVKNYGSVPAVEYKSNSRLTVNAVPLHNARMEQGTQVIPPQGGMGFTVELDGTDFDSVNRSKRLDIFISLTYQGMDKKPYVYEQEYMYNHDTGVISFMKTRIT